MSGTGKGKLVFATEYVAKFEIVRMMLRMPILLFSMSVLVTAMTCVVGCEELISGLPQLPLSTSSRWIVDATNTRVKLACVSWPSHMEVMIPEGLHQQPIFTIATILSSSGFNCVRLTYATYTFTDPTLREQTVTQSLSALNLTGAVEGIHKHNPHLADLTLVEAYEEVIKGLADANLMAVLDNHISKPGWCCSTLDGGGFWGDIFFNPVQWLQGLQEVARLSLKHANVVGMSLRNEPRGPRQNPADWYKYEAEGGQAVYNINPALLIFLSGLSYASDLTFLYEKPITFREESLRRKLVYEVHWYAWYSATSYSRGNPNSVCAADMARVMNGTGYLVSVNKDYTSPLFVSEFGTDESGINVEGNLFMDCFVALAAKLDLDWALWALPGSYYWRDSQVDFEESYGLVTKNWATLRNATFMERLKSLQQPLPDHMHDLLAEH